MACPRVPHALTPCKAARVRSTLEVILDVLGGCCTATRAGGQRRIKQAKTGAGRTVMIAVDDRQVACLGRARCLYRHFLSAFSPPQILIASITGEIDWTGALCRGWMSVTVTYPIWTADGKPPLAHAPGFPLVEWGFSARGRLKGGLHRLPRSIDIGVRRMNCPRAGSRRACDPKRKFQGRIQ